MYDYIGAFERDDRHLSVDLTFREDNSIHHCVKRNRARLLASTYAMTGSKTIKTRDLDSACVGYTAIAFLTYDD